MLDAYTVRKAIPRIVIAVIGINLSIYLCVFLIDLTNVIGNGLGNLIAGPFVGDGLSIEEQNFSGNPVTQGVLGVIFLALLKSVVAGPGILALIGSLFPLILIALLVALAVLFTLVIRQGLLLFLTVISPVAIALSILPGTEKYFKKWFDLFVKTLMVYPIIAVLFAVSTAMVAILLGNANAVQGTDQTIKLLAGIVVIYAPLVLIPFAFKLAGGAIATVMNAAQGATDKTRRKLGDARGKSLAEATARNKEAIAAGTRYKRNNILSRTANTALQTGSIMSSGKLSRSKIQAERTVRDSMNFKKAMENEHVASVISNDDLLDAYANDGMAGARRYFETELGMTGRELEQNLASVEAAERAVGAQTFREVASVANAGTGSGYAGGSVQMLRALDRAAGGDAQKRGRLVAMARSNAERANRPDLAAPFAGSMQTMAAIADGRLDDAAAGRDLDREVVRTKGASVAMQSRGQAADRLIGSRDGQTLGALGEMLAEADARLATAEADVRRTQVPTQSQLAQVEAAQTERLRVQAVLANMYDSASYGPEENAERLGHVMTQGSGRFVVDQETGQQREMTRLEELEMNRGDARFRAFRREYSQDTSKLTPEQREALARSGVPVQEQQQRQ